MREIDKKKKISRKIYKKSNHYLKRQAQMVTSFKYVTKMSLILLQLSSTLISLNLGDLYIYKQSFFYQSII